MTDIFDRSLDEVDIEISDNKIKKGEEVNLTARDPTMTKILVAVGWRLNAFDSEVLDADISCFLLDKNGQTRKDSDFVFYNNLEDGDKSVVHNGDNMIGAGDGDDETVSIDLHGIPFDVLSVVFVMSIYRGEEKSQQMSSIRSGYIRLINSYNSQEMLRYEISDNVEDSRGETAMLVASLNREGPKWHFKAIGELVEGGLAKVATDYGMIVHTG